MHEKNAFFSPVPSIKQCIFELRNYVLKWKEAKRTQARFTRKIQMIFCFFYLEFLNFFRFGDFPFGNAGVEKWGCDRDTQSFGSHPGVSSFRIDVNFIEGPDKQHQQMLRIVR